MGWEGQLFQLADLLENDPESGMQSLGGFLRPMDDTGRYGPTYGDAREGAEEAADELAKEMPDEHGPMNLNESTVIARAASGRAVTIRCLECGLEVAGRENALGEVRPSDGPHEGPVKDGLCMEHAPKLNEWEDMRREMLRDEIEMDML